MEHTIGIKQENLSKVTEQLNTFLADEYLVYTKTKNAHWNTEGRDFYDKHKFYEMQFEELDKIIDDLAERIRTLGHYAPATLKQFLQLTHLTEAPGDIKESRDFVKELLADHQSIIIHFRENIDRFANGLGDQGTSDFITGIMEKHEKMAWMLQEQLNKITTH
ncbi:MAG TPA: DNA starvation/stationary phase protection protein [Chitinophagaceae bacterium]|nr:DNA starvation/stationary phase protection protein [Chitinophagaceae bacterium]